MYQIIKNYCENDQTNGLFLMDMPTGFGKTYNVIKYIYEAAIDDSNRDKKYFFITTLKKNLPTEELRGKFTENHQEQLFFEKFLFIDSNADCVKENWSEELEKSIPSEIKKSDEYQEFRKNIRFLQKAENEPALRAFSGSIMDNLRMKAEPAFRQIIHTILMKEFPTVDKRLYAIRQDEKWKWLGKLYPAVFTKDRQIIFMSMDKFLTKNNTIVQPSYSFLGSDLIKDAIIFIDEFDATKETMLKSIIKDGLYDKVDFVELFKEIYSAMQTVQFPAALTIPSKERQQSEYADQPLESILDKVRENAEKIYHNYSLQLSHRTTEVEESSLRNFMFQDHKFIPVCNAGKQYVITQRDDIRKINAIIFSKEKPKSDANNVQVLLGNLRGFVTWFSGAVRILSRNYWQRKIENRNPGDDEFTYEAAIGTVLSLFGLKDEYQDYLTSQVLFSSKNSKIDYDFSDFDLSFYENGFRYYAFEDDLYHDMQSKIMACAFQNTPEKVLLKICEKAKVIGISATATLDTVIGNFDIEYLKSRLQSSYVDMTENDRKRLSEEFVNGQAGYSNVNIQCELLGDKDPKVYARDSWLKVYDSAELAQHIFDYIQDHSSMGKESNHYNEERYLRIALAYKRFITHSDIKSFLCVLTKHPKNGDADLNLEILYEIFDRILAENGWMNKKSRETVEFLTGEEYFEKKSKITKRLEKGDKLFVISVYQTIGAGQNLQYQIPTGLEETLILLNENRSFKEKDYDAIYLDKPTNLLVNYQYGKEIEEEEFIKSLFQYEYLQENAELDPKSTEKYIRNAFRHYRSSGLEHKETVDSIRDTRSIRMLATRYIIQAIGRICRTNAKNKNIYIYADSKIADSLDLSVEKERLLNYEFKKLLDTVRESEYHSPEEKSLCHKAVLNSIRVNKWIDSKWINEWTNKKIIQWKEMREVVLRMPTMSCAEEGIARFIANDFYVLLPEKQDRYYYSQRSDFKEVSISFTKDEKNTLSVSSDGAKLDSLMKFSFIKEWFMSQGYATEFTPNDYIMSPPLWNNIYKGALGEVVGQYLFEKCLHVKLEEIKEPELFEKFDFKVKDLPIYVDFKNWHVSTDFDRSEYLNKILVKAKECNAKGVIVANILTESDYYPSYSTEMDGIKILVTPSILTESPAPSFNNDAGRALLNWMNQYDDKNE